MSKRFVLAALIAGALLWWYHDRRPSLPAPAPPPTKPEPKKPKPPKPRRPRRPCPGPGPCPLSLVDGGWWLVDGNDNKPPSTIHQSPTTREGGGVYPDGVVEVVCDLPAAQRKKNIPSKGLGCCVFRSLDYAARWQQVPELFDLPEQLVKAGIPGGGYPGKVDDIMKQFAPDADYLNDTSGDAEILEAILATGRMPCVTYSGHDCHYSGGIAHMVCLTYFDRHSDWACVSDNNFPQEGQFVWMSASAFLQRWKGGGGGGWVCALLAPPPPLPPHN